MILLADSEGHDQTARMRSLIRDFTVRISPKATFSHGVAHRKNEVKYWIVNN